MTRLTLASDMIRSFETYTLPTDELKDFQIYGSAKGSMTIKCYIEREDQQYRLDTEVIYAGGHNIQRLHYRYITKTELPKQSNLTVYKEYVDKIKRLSKGEKIQKEINMYKVTLAKNKDANSRHSTFTDEQILQYEKEQDLKYNRGYNWPTWEEIVSRGSDVNYANSEEVYNAAIKADSDDTIKRFKNSLSVNIRRTNEIEKLILKLEAKLDQLIVQVN
jgi:hypothetical protein